MEPFEVLRDMIRSGAYSSIGGAPQAAKVYRFLQTQHFAVRWPTGKDMPHILGRPALSYERLGAPSIDPDAPAIQASWQLSRYAQEAAAEAALAYNYTDNDEDADPSEIDDYSY
jgi:hypothetical protein